MHATMIMYLQFYLGATLVAVVFIYNTYVPRDLLMDIASSWDREITEPKGKFSKILVGVNTNLDMVVSAVDLLEALNLSSTTPQDHPSLNSLEKLEQLVAFSMYHCAGVERPFNNQALFNHITSIATSLSHVYHIGGNAALIAEKLKSTFPHIEVVLVGSVGRRLKKLLSHHLITPTYTHGVDEVHMILEYSDGSQWGQIEANCANRVIFSHDISNSNMSALESMENIVQQFAPDLVILSGAHLLEGQKRAVWKQRLKVIDKLLDSTLNSIPVHWELGTIGNLEFFQQLANNLFPRINSLGLNEQELLSAAKSANAPFDFKSVPQKPGIEWVSDLLHWLMLTYGLPGGMDSSLTRIHLHSLSFHMIATVNGGPWSDSMKAVMAGARMAGLQACETDTFSLSNFKLLHPREFYVSRTDSFLSRNIMVSTNGLAQWSRDNVTYYLSPVLVCKNPTKTVGLGDAISSLGLVHSIYDDDY